MQYLKREIRDRILQAAVEEFKEHGFSDASIRNIANNAEISLGNVYRYFSNKETLYFAVIDPFMDSVKSAVENDFVFEGKTMGEIAETLVAFIMKYSDELIIIRKGNSVHHDNFINYIVGALAGKIKEMIQNAFPEIDEKITDPIFYDAIAEGFLTSLFKVLSYGENDEQKERYIRELLTFFFGHLVDRFYHFDME
mgnify:FL=1